MWRDNYGFYCAKPGCTHKVPDYGDICYECGPLSPLVPGGREPEPEPEPEPDQEQEIDFDQTSFPVPVPVPVPEPVPIEVKVKEKKDRKKVQAAATGKKKRPNLKKQKNEKKFVPPPLRALSHFPHKMQSVCGGEEKGWFPNPKNENLWCDQNNLTNFSSCNYVIEKGTHLEAMLSLYLSTIGVYPPIFDMKKCDEEILKPEPFFEKKELLAQNQKYVAELKEKQILRGKAQVWWVRKNLTGPSLDAWIQHNRNNIATKYYPEAKIRARFLHLWENLGILVEKMDSSEANQNETRPEHFVWHYDPEIKRFRLYLLNWSFGTVDVTRARMPNEWRENKKLEKLNKQQQKKVLKFFKDHNQKDKPMAQRICELLPLLLWASLTPNPATPTREEEEKLRKIKVEMEKMWEMIQAKKAKMEALWIRGKEVINATISHYFNSSTK